MSPGQDNTKYKVLVPQDINKLSQGTICKTPPPEDLMLTWSSKEFIQLPVRELSKSSVCPAHIGSSGEQAHQDLCVGSERPGASCASQYARVEPIVTLGGASPRQKKNRPLCLPV